MDEHSKKNGTLVLITNHFPYGRAEAFLESEVPYLLTSFEKVIILSRDVTSIESRIVPGDFIVYRLNPQSTKKELLITPWLYMQNAIRVFRYLLDELSFFIQQRKRLTLSICSVIFHDLSKALITSYHIRKILKLNHREGRVTLYSYWLNSSALASTFVHFKNYPIKRISRAHAGDVYETHFNKNNYLSFRTSLIKNLDKIFTVSKDALEHLSQKVQDTHPVKIEVSRLGTHYNGKSPQKNNAGYLLVSCSFLRPIKRIPLIIDSLEKIQDLTIRWIHIGDGPLMNEVITYAHYKLGKKNNIAYDFMGTMSNADLLQFYQQHYIDLFINTSESEGVPVTMMEAQSFEIPIVALDVGGVREIVTDNCGRLLPSHASPDSISKAIVDILSLPPGAYHELRKNALQNWENLYNADKNFSTFVATIRKL